MRPGALDPGETIAVVGSGPAGLSCAYHLARFGYGVVRDFTGHGIGTARDRQTRQIGQRSPIRALRIDDDGLAQQVIDDRLVVGLEADQVSPKAYWGRGRANASHGEPARDA